MTTVFISHDHDDVDFANTVIREIERRGFEHWIDSEQIGLGEDWRQKIDDAIRNSFALIVIVTPAAVSSEYVTYEWIFALGAGIKVIPLLFQPVERLHPKMHVMNWADFTDARARRFDLLIDELERAKIQFDQKNENKVEKPATVNSLVLPLLNDFTSPNNRVRRAAVNAVKGLKTVEAIPHLIQTLDDSDEAVRVAAADALAWIGDKQGVPKLMVVAGSDEAEKVRCTATEALGWIRDDSSTWVLIEILVQDTSDTVRKSAAWALGMIGDTMAVPILGDKLLNDKSDWVRRAVAEALESINDAEATPELILSLNTEKSDLVREVVVEALLRIGTTEAKSAVDEWKKQTQSKGDEFLDQF